MCVCAGEGVVGVQGTDHGGSSHGGSDIQGIIQSALQFPLTALTNSSLEGAIKLKFVPFCSS